MDARTQVSMNKPRIGETLNSLRNFVVKHIDSHFSDGTLNPNGVRFGSAEIYQVGKLLLLDIRSNPQTVKVKVSGLRFLPM